LVGVFVNRLAGFIQIYLVLFLTHRGYTAGQAGLGLGVYGAGAVLGTFVGGSMTDRLSPRTATLASMLGSTVFILSILYLPVYPLLLLAVLLVSTVGQFYRPAAQAMLTELTPPARLVMVTAMYRLGMNLGTTVTPLLGAALLSVSYDLLFWFEAAAALVYAVIAYTALPRETPERSAEAESAVSAARGYRVLLGDRRYLLFLAAVFLMSAAYCQYISTLPLAITHAGLSVWWYSAVVALNGFIVITSELLMTKVVQRWPLRLTMLIGLGLVAVGYGTYAIALVPVLLILGTVIWTLSEIVGAPTVFAYPGIAAPPHQQGRYIGAMQSLFGLGAAVGPVLGVLLWTWVGQDVWLWVAGSAALATVCGVAAVRDPAAHATAAAG
jgi:predicted MFS family arabinose efflux permease